MAILKVRNEEGKMVPVPAIIGPPGPKGETGPQGEQGKPFTYDDFTEEQLALLKGSKGDKGDTGPKGDKGNEGPQGARGPMGVQGLRGPEGPEGPKGDKGDPGTPGKNGKSAYDYAKEGGYTGTEEEFAEMMANGSNRTDNGGSAGVTSWNDLEDKPFGEEYVENEFFNGTLNFVNGVFANNIYFIEDFTSNCLTIGTRYKVNWNGIEYECVAIDGGDTYVYIGSQQMSPGWSFPTTIESDEPFFISTSKDYYHTMVSAGSKASVAIEVIEMAVGSVKQLDEKFIPETIARKRDIPENTDVPENVLVYDSQELTNEQQMQVRKNLGLYNKQEVEKFEVLYTNMYWGNAWYPEDATDNLTPVFESDKEYIVSLAGNEYKVRSRHYDQEVHMAGVIYSIHWIGNANLIEREDYLPYRDENTDIPFVIYWVDPDGEDIKDFDEHPHIITNSDISVNRYDEITVSASTGIETVYETIPEEYIPEIDGVRYTEQSLTEEQQMQARKNLGLYGKSEKPLSLTDSIETWSSVSTEIVNFSPGNTVNVRITQMDTLLSEYVLELNEQYDYGSDITYRWYGNGCLINSTLFVDTGEGIVIYQQNGSNWNVYIHHSRIENGIPHTEFYVDIIDPNRTEVVTETIPEEYIPETIARKDYVEGMLSNGSGGSGKAKTQVLLDLTFEELTNIIEIPLEHNFHRLYVKWLGNEYVRLVNSENTAVNDTIAFLVDTTSFAWNGRNVLRLVSGAGTWASTAAVVNYSDDCSLYLYNIVVHPGFGEKNVVTNIAGAPTYDNENCLLKGRKLYITSGGNNYFNVGTTLIIYGEYFE